MKTRNYHGVSLARRLSISAAAFAVAFFGAASGSSLAFADPGTPPGSTDEDPAANQVFTIPADATTPEALNKLLQGLNDTVENNSAIQKMNELGKTINVEQGKVAELTSNFGGWTPVDGGKFAIAQKTDKGVFPVETVNTTRAGGNEGGKEELYRQENSFDRSSDYILLLSKVRTGANTTETTFDGKTYKNSNEPGYYAGGVAGFNGIEKTFKAYSPETGSNAVITFKTGYTGDIEGHKAQYKVEVFKGKTTTEKLYETNFKPQENSANDKHTVSAAKDGSGSQLTVTGLSKTQVEDKLAENKPDGTAGLFTSKEISIPKDVTEYTVRISSYDNEKLGMSYQSKHLQYALPLTGVDFSITQDTKAAAKMVLQKIYDSLSGTQEADTKKMTSESVTPYKEKLDAAKNLLAQADLAATSAYKSAAQETMEAKNALVPAEKIAIEKITIAAQEKMDAIAANSTLSPAEQEQFKKLVDDKKAEALTAVKNAADTAAIISAQDKGLAEIAKINPVGHEAAKKAINDALTAKTTEITNNTSLTDAEKNTAIQQAQTIATTHLDAINNQPTTTTTPDEAATAQQAITTATQTGVNGINQINPVGHEAAKKAINDALTAKTTEITNNTSLTDAEKNTAIQQAQTIATTHLDAINNQPTTTTTPDEAATAQQAITTATQTGVNGINQINPVGHEAAKKAINDALTAKTTEITNNTSLTDAEKNTAIQQAQTIATTHLDAINNQPTTTTTPDEAATAQQAITTATQTGVNGINQINPVGHEAAKKAINDALTAKTTEITNNTSLTDAEKNTAIQQAQTIATTHLDAINNQPTTTTTPDEAATAQQAITTATQTGVNGINQINPVGHEAAKKAINDALTAKTTEITNNTSLTDAEKNTAIQQAQTIATTHLDAINNQPTTTTTPDEAATAQQAITTATQTGVNGINQINPVGHEAAKKAINDALTAKTTEITNNTSLTDAEKNTAIQQAQTIATTHLDAINNQPTTTTTPDEAATAQQAITTATQTGVNGINQINPVGHEAAKKAINDALTAKTTEITNNTSLTDAEKNTAIQQAQTIATTHLDAINNQPTTTTTPDEAATAQQAITTATQTGVNGINQINPVGHEAAKKAINDALTAKTTEITNNTSLTDAEKNTAIQQAQTIATTHLDAINNQPTTTTTPDEAATAQQAINEARDAAVREIGKIQPKPAAKPASPSGKAHSASTPTPKGMPNTGSTGLGLAGLCGLLMAGAGIALRRRSAAKMSA